MESGEKTPKRVLIIEDDQEIADLITLHFHDQYYVTVHCRDGRDGLQTALDDSFDLIVLDIMLPGIDGLEVCRRLREKRAYVPILMLTSRVEELDRVLGLELGADDYLTKPFSIRELIARVKAIFRRVESITSQSDKPEENGLKRMGELEIDVQKRRVSIAGNPVELTVKEFDLLQLFAAHPGMSYSRQQLLNAVWGYQFEGYDHTVNSHINRLRAKIERDPANPRYIKTVWGYGYRFAEPEELDD